MYHKNLSFYRTLRESVFVEFDFYGPFVVYFCSHSRNRAMLVLTVWYHVSKMSMYQSTHLVVDEMAAISRSTSSYAFFEWKVRISLKFVPIDNKTEDSIGSGNGLVMDRRQSFTRTNDIQFTYAYACHWGLGWWVGDGLKEFFLANMWGYGGTLAPSEHYNDVMISAVASQLTSLTIVYSTVYSGADQSKHQSSASLAFVWGIHRGPVNSPHKWPVTRKIFSFDDVIMNYQHANSIPISSTDKRIEHSQK